MKISERYNGFLILEEPVLGGSVWYAVPDVYKENTKVLVSVALTPLKSEILKIIKNAENPPILDKNTVCPVCGEPLPDSSYYNAEYGACWDCVERYENARNTLEDD